MKLSTFVMLSTMVVVFLSTRATPLEMKSLLCASSGGLVVGLGLGLGLGYLAFGFPWRNSGGVWAGNGGAGFWLPRGRKKRDISGQEDLDDMLGDLRGRWWSQPKLI